MVFQDSKSFVRYYTLEKADLESCSNYDAEYRNDVFKYDTEDL